MSRRKRKGRPVNGILLLDKAIGYSSNKVLQQLKYIFQAQKAGHTGSLDPLASGLLPICFGDATKLSSYMLESDKTYIAEAKLGAKTDTADAEGEVIETRLVPELSESDLEAVLQQFKNEQKQLPPMYSALKHKEQPLYKLARNGQHVEREPRTIVIYDIKLLAYESNEQKIEFSVRCSKGTYVRTLAEDIGEKLGCGAYISALRRTHVGNFNVDDAYNPHELELIAEQDGLEGLDQLLLPVETAIEDWPEVILSGDNAYYLLQGQAVLVPKAPTAGRVRLFEDNNRFLGIGEILEDGRVAPKRLINVA